MTCESCWGMSDSHMTCESRLVASDLHMTYVRVVGAYQTYTSQCDSFWQVLAGVWESGFKVVCLTQRKIDGEK